MCSLKRIRSYNRKALLNQAYLWAFFCLVVAGLLAVMQGVSRADRGATPVDGNILYSIPRLIQYSFTLHNQTNQRVAHPELWLPGPVKENATQRCVDLDASHPFEVITDQLGNQTLHFSFDEIAPYATVAVSVRARLALSATPHPVKNNDRSLYFGPSQHCESDSAEIRRLAGTLKADQPIKTLWNIFRWVSSNVEYVGYLANVRGARYALVHRKGDCTEFSYLFAALSRANGLAARVIGGYVVTKDSVLSPRDYHNWAEFRDMETWQVADPLAKRFVQDQWHYVAMRIIGDDRGDDRPNSVGQQGLFYVLPEQIKVTMDG